MMIGPCPLRPVAGACPSLRLFVGARPAGAALRRHSPLGVVYLHLCAHSARGSLRGFFSGQDTHRATPAGRPSRAVSKFLISLTQLKSRVRDSYSAISASWATIPIQTHNLAPGAATGAPGAILTA